MRRDNARPKAALKYLGRSEAALAIRPCDKRPLGAWKQW
jgi:hypothetical protein